MVEMDVAFCCALLGDIPVLDELALLFFAFTFSLEFVFSFITA